MNIQIQISDNGAVTSSTDTSASTGGLTTPGAAGNASDGGAPKASLTGGDNSSGTGGSDTTDIGGPPQWLSDSIKESGGGIGGNTASASAISSEGGDGQDAGVAPSFG